jgi:hypothetical protein
MLWFKTIDKVLANFEQVIADLNELKDKHYAQAISYGERIEELEEERDIAFLESKRASDVAAKLSKLIGK